MTGGQANKRTPRSGQAGAWGPPAVARLQGGKVKNLAMSQS